MPLILATLVVLLQVVSGSLLILLIHSSRKRSGYEILGLGLALGSFLFLLSAALFVNTAIASTGWLIPSLLILFGAAIQYKKLIQRIRGLTWSRSESLAIALGLGLGLALILVNWIRVPLETIRAGGSVDMYFFEALSRGISQFGPEHSILMSGGQLRYHWFSYGWAGDLATIAGLDSFVSLTRVLPVVALIGVVLLSAAWAGKMTLGKAKSPRWVPSLAVLLVVVAGYSGALYGIILNFDSPSQAFTTIWLLALVIAFLQGLSVKTTLLLLPSGVLVALLASATTGGKASHAIVALGGFGFLALIGVIFRLPWWRNAISLFVFALIGFLLTYFWVLAGVGIGENLAESIFVRASTWQQLDPVAGRWGPLLGTIALLLAVLARLSGVFWLSGKREGRTSPEFLFSIGAIATGFAALLALRGGINDLWFLLALSAPVAVISAFGVGQAMTWVKPHVPRGLGYALAVGLTGSILSLVLSRNWQFTDPPNDFFLWPGILFWLSIVGPWLVIFVVSWLIVRRLKISNRAIRRGSVLALSISALVFTSIFTRPAVLWTQARELVTEIGIVAPLPESNTAADIESESTNSNAPFGDPLYEDRREAARWLVSNSLPDHIVATNNPDNSFIPAFTGNQMYLAGERYQRGLGATSEKPEIDRRFEITRSLFTNQSSVSAEEMCNEGVSYLWIEYPPPSIELPSAQRHDFGLVTIFELTGTCK